MGKHRWKHASIIKGAEMDVQPEYGVIGDRMVNTDDHRLRPSQPLLQDPSMINRVAMSFDGLQ